MIYFYIKSLHIIFVVTWFAGLFYIFRLFIYHTEANLKPEPNRSILIEQLSIMEHKLWYIITWPSAILTFIFGFWLVYLLNVWNQPWMHLKLTFVFGLACYQLYGQRVIQQLKKGEYKNTSLQLRIWNEVATVVLIAVVFIVIFKDTLSWLWGLLGIFGVVVTLMIAIKLYKKNREKNENT
jgi:putative membrane protein